MLCHVFHQSRAIDAFQAIVTAYEDPKLNEVFLASRAIMFMGTPHRGSDIAKTAANFAAVANLPQAVPGLSFFVGPVRADLFNLLIRDSSILDDIDDSFRHRIGNIVIMSCYETELIEGSRKLASSRPFHTRALLLVTNLPEDSRTTVCSSWVSS